MSNRLQASFIVVCK